MVDLVKIKNVCSAEVNVKIVRAQATDEEKVFAKGTWDEGPLPKNTRGTLRTQHEENKQPDHRMGRRPEHRPPQTSCADGAHACEGEPTPRSPGNAN